MSNKGLRAGPCGRLRRRFATYPPKQSFFGASPLRLDAPQVPLPNTGEQVFRETASRSGCRGGPQRTAAPTMGMGVGRGVPARGIRPSNGRGGGPCRPRERSGRGEQDEGEQTEEDEREEPQRAARSGWPGGCRRTRRCNPVPSEWARGAFRAFPRVRRFLFEAGSTIGRFSPQARRAGWIGWRPSVRAFRPARDRARRAARN